MQTFINLSDLRPNPRQPRKFFDPEELAGLGKSIQEGTQLHPIAVEDNGDGTYNVIDGERRWRAMELIKRTEIEAIVRPSLGTDDDERLIQAVVANLQRADLGPVEFARACGQLRDMGYSNRAIADRFGCYPEKIRTALKILDLDEELIALVGTGDLPKDPRVIDALLSIQNREARIRLGTRIARPGVGIKAIVNACARLNESLLQKTQSATSSAPAVALTQRADYKSQNTPTPWPTVRAAVKGMCDQCDANPRLPSAPEPAWSFITQAAEVTCNTCNMRTMPINNGLSICKECPAVDLLRRLANVSK